jgi:hypothetical protein
MRRIARILQINLKTVARKLKFLGLQAQELNRRQTGTSNFEEIQFDEMETFEHSKCKPLSLPLIVEAKTRWILGFDVCSMPATGHLAKIARKKYGYRPDHRRKTLDLLLSSLKPRISAQALISTDEKTLYRPLVRRHFPEAVHKTYKGRRGCVVGQGELKRGGFDPIFSLNQTAAMLRANINRLFRRTWCTTKRPDHLKHHIELYIKFHNNRLIRN